MISTSLREHNRLSYFFLRTIRIFLRAITKVRRGARDRFKKIISRRVVARFPASD